MVLWGFKINYKSVVAFDVEWKLNIQNQLISRGDTPTETWFCTDTLTGAIDSGALVVRQQEIATAIGHSDTQSTSRQINTRRSDCRVWRVCRVYRVWTVCRVYRVYRV